MREATNAWKCPDALLRFESTPYTGHSWFAFCPEQSRVLSFLPNILRGGVTHQLPWDWHNASVGDSATWEKPGSPPTPLPPSLIRPSWTLVKPCGDWTVQCSVNTGCFKRTSPFLRTPSNTFGQTDQFLNKVRARSLHTLEKLLGLWVSHFAHCEVGGSDKQHLRPEAPARLCRLPGCFWCHRLCVSCASLQSRSANLSHQDAGEKNICKPCLPSLAIN